MAHPMRLVTMLGLAAAVFVLQGLAGPALALEEVSFESAIYPPSAFMVEQARRQGRAVQPKPGKTIPAFLARPEGAGAFPAVVLMHGGGGMGPWNQVWRERLVGWGYVVLDVDSFGPRTIATFADGEFKLEKPFGPLTRALDAHGAKRYLAGLSFVDPSRIAVMGMSHGGMSALQAIHGRTTGKIGARPFSAAVALYPICEPHIDPDTPLLVLIGALDNWTTVDYCERFEAAFRNDPEVTVVIYPGAYHVFDLEGVNDTYRDFYIMRYHPEAAEDAKRRVKAFLDAHL